MDLLLCTMLVGLALNVLSGPNKTRCHVVGVNDEMNKIWLWGVIWEVRIMDVQYTVQILK